MQAPNRAQIAEKDRWRLEDIYPTDEVWQADYRALAARKDEIGAYEGKLNEAEAVLACLRLSDEIGRQVSKLYVYAKMRQDQDMNVEKYQAMTAQIEALSVDIAARGAFVNAELAGNDARFLEALSRRPEFADYDYFLRELVRNKQRMLSSGEEKLLAMSRSFSGMFQDAFMMFDNADVEFKQFRTADGTRVRLSHGIYSLILQSEDRGDRKKAFESMFGAYRKMIHTISVLYAGNVKADAYYAKARKFDGALEAAMNGENVPVEIYRKLVACVHDRLPLLHRYLEYRRQRLGYDELHMYDLHVPVCCEGSLSVPYAEARRLVKEALRPLGEEYGALLDRAFGERWIDVYENKGKRSGAYSWGCYDSHPYVLMNYQPTTHDVFTIAHELGHSLHSFYSDRSQPYAKAGYEIFVAEVASTVNETLLQRYLLERSDKETKRFLLSYMADMFRTTVFRQTQFAEFEEQAHRMEEGGEPLTADALCALYARLNDRYYGGKHVVRDEPIRYEWARIPHFYNSFYVYKYATGLISAVCIADRILREGAPAVEDYRRFLSAGGSMPPAEILKLAGVDLTTDAPYRQALDFLERTLDELEHLD